MTSLDGEFFFFFTNECNLVFCIAIQVGRHSQLARDSVSSNTERPANMGHCIELCIQNPILKSF